MTEHSARPAAPSPDALAGGTDSAGGSQTLRRAVRATSTRLVAIVVVTGIVGIAAALLVNLQQREASEQAMPYLANVEAAAVAAKAAANDERGYLLTGDQ